ncbi:hypothetical protein DC363_15090 [Thalassorhabdomicrobium marinisediminis]|uniref:KfrA N-terminal DNA-binding domain-containing protein n=1 Tax=Thalassorhabdomicrobium marinisediminis TaxID=2170577 RepID=A0A2T7FT63_9RHOB|nr:hypothetical protein DC363_15090 [Thalassorhabdomicrobium marinisediminis]
MMRKPIYTNAEIIEAGENLLLRRGSEVSATDIHKELGGKGKYSRVRNLWEAHCATREEEQSNDDPLPDEVQEQIDQAIVGLEKSMRDLVQAQISRMTEQSVRQFAIRERDFVLLEKANAKKVQALEAEIAYLTERLDEFCATEEEEHVSENADRAHERSVSAKPAPAPVAPVAARKTPDRPLPRTHRPAQKTARQPSARPKKSPQQERTRS